MSEEIQDKEQRLIPLKQKYMPFWSYWIPGCLRFGGTWIILSIWILLRWPLWAYLTGLIVQYNTQILLGILQSPSEEIKKQKWQKLRYNVFLCICNVILL